MYGKYILKTCVSLLMVILVGYMFFTQGRVSQQDGRHRGKYVSVVP